MREFVFATHFASRFLGPTRNKKNEYHGNDRHQKQDGPDKSPIELYQRPAPSARPYASYKRTVFSVSHVIIRFICEDPGRSQSPVHLAGWRIDASPGTKSVATPTIGYAMSTNTPFPATSRSRRRRTENSDIPGGSRYRPLLTIQDAPNRGQRRRTYCPVIRRLVHTLCRIDYAVYLYAYFTEKYATDFQEYYPLDVAKSTAIARELNFGYPVGDDNFPRVLCTKLRVTREENGVKSYVVFNGVDTRARKSQTLELLRLLDQVYWGREPAHTWVSRTEKDIPEHLCANAEWLLPFIERDVLLGVTDIQIDRAAKAMRPAFMAGKLSFNDITSSADNECGLKPGEASRIARHLMASRVWNIEIFAKLDPQRPITFHS